MAYAAKRQDKEIGKTDSNYRCYTFDLQQYLPKSSLNSSVAFYKRALWTYNLTVHNCGSSDVTCYMWHKGEEEEIKLLHAPTKSLCLFQIM